MKYTIVIPTRERPDTLYAALKTCVNQNYANLEIIVSDNYSCDKTEDVVDSFQDPRIRYINTGKRVSMSENWEFALTYVSGDYVTYLGDDDGFIPESVDEINKIIEENDNIEAVSWAKADYMWPNHIDENKRNLITIPLNNILKICESRNALINTIESKSRYITLPCLYNSFIRFDIIKNIVSHSGRFFNSMNPDIYSGIAIASMSNQYYYSSKPYTIAGQSHHSTGESSLSPDKRSTSFQTFLTENNIPFHEKLIMAPSIIIYEAESLLQAREHIPSANLPSIDFKHVIKQALKEVACESPLKYRKVVEAVRIIGSKHSIDDYVSKVISNYPNTPGASHVFIGYNMILNTLRLRSNEFGVKDVYDASLLCKSILTLQEHKYFSLRNIIKSHSILLLDIFRNPYWFAQKVRSRSWMFRL